MDTYQQKTQRIQTQTIRQQKRNARPAVTRIPVVCMECNKKFSTTKVIPDCPKCGGSDMEVR